MEELELQAKNLPITLSKAVECAYKSMKGELIGVEDVAVFCDISIVTAMALLTNQFFGMLVHHLQVANAKHAFDAVAYNTLLKIARHSEDDKNKISAIRALGDLLGYNESKKVSMPEINIHIDQIVREKSVKGFEGF